MTRRVCPKPGCPNFRPCPDHKRASSHARGYDRDHRDERKDWVDALKRGATVQCRRVSSGTCIEPDPLIRLGDQWDLGHPDAECPAPRAPEHLLCNRAAGGRSAHAE